MSKEREMIEKLCSFQMTYSDWLLLIADAEELLAQPEHLGGVTDMVERKQPLRELININKEWHQIGYEKAKQELKREPLSVGCIQNGLSSEEVPDYKSMTFIKGIRFAEKQHGIGGEE